MSDFNVNLVGKKLIIKGRSNIGRPWIVTGGFGSKPGSMGRKISGHFEDEQKEKPGEHIGFMIGGIWEVKCYAEEESKIIIEEDGMGFVLEGLINGKVEWESYSEKENFRVEIGTGGKYSQGKMEAAFFFGRDRKNPGAAFNCFDEFRVKWRKFEKHILDNNVVDEMPVENKE